MPQDRRLRASTSGCTPSRQPDSPLALYGETLGRLRRALADRLRHGAELGAELDAESGAAESLEFLRAVLHIELDHAIDAEALNWPSARRLIFRPGRYRRSQ